MPIDDHRTRRPRNRRFSSRLLGAVFLFAAAMVVLPDYGKAQATPPSPDWFGAIPSEPSDDWEIAFGGRLYDSWALSLRKLVARRKTHSSYPKNGKAKGYATWRCKECHGWDTKGAEGAYGKGSHKTGIKGLRHLMGGDPGPIVAALADTTHRYDAEMIPPEAARRLALFLTRGQIDTDRYIDAGTRKAKGDLERGRGPFQNLCASCHGFDGTAIDFSHTGEPEFVGTAAAGNPWAVLHKLVNGQPGSTMPAMRGLPMQTVVDILAYSQTLPVK